MKLNVEKLGIDKRIREQLLDASYGDKVIEAELYKLNWEASGLDKIIGKGSFFKPHKDTPRGGDMFGSLVIVFPTLHEGGGLVLRHAGQEWTFDSATLVSKNEQPSIAYIAFYSDVEHEVNVVQSGHRVTLTYSLFLRDAPTLPSTVKPVAPDSILLRDALYAALDNPNFLPDGGYIGFGLNFQYPVPGTEGSALKGSDATIYRVCRDLSLDTALEAIYTDRLSEERILVPIRYSEDLAGQLLEDDLSDFLCGECEGRVVKDPSAKSEDGVDMVWVVPPTHYSRFGTTYVTYGNEPSEGYTYADLCISVEVGPFGKRHKTESTDDESSD
ncbi:hypothetical protein H0H92_006638 [Tricholoma furcatifolium]|nr:hypothetical protein H0H92_006638 [Tricholoma furcatifolium]